MKRSSLLALFVLGLLIGSSPVFGNFGSNRLTSGGFILKGILTSGGNTVTSASYNLFGGISFGGAYSTSASYKLVHQWPALLSPISTSQSLAESGPAPLDALIKGVGKFISEALSISDALD